MDNTVSDPIQKEGNDNFFDSFRTVSEQRPLSLFLGAGLDADAGFPGLLELLKPVAKELKVSIDGKTDLFELAQFYEDKYTRNALLGKIRERLQNSNRESLLLSTVMQLNVQTIWTTNYDSMIEEYLKKMDTPFSKIYKPQQLNEIRENVINIIKINGDLDNSESIIITKKELQTHKIKHHLFFDFLTKELTTDTFLFVGYSFKDDLVLKNIAELREVLGEYAPMHYSIQKQVDPKKNVEFKMQQYDNNGNLYIFERKY